MVARADGGRRSDWRGDRVFRSYRIPADLDEFIKSRGGVEGDVIVEALTLYREVCGGAPPDVSTRMLASALDGLRASRV